MSDGEEELSLTGFNSRTPGGVRLYSTMPSMPFSVFQFTHPGRGATISFARLARCLGVSIHAPREGCDEVEIQFRKDVKAVSIHAPREGCDTLEGGQLIVEVTFQFTHPGRGATSAQRASRSTASYFNSRTPGGVRPFSEVELVNMLEFQFTHPGRGATASLSNSRSFRTFQFTHPGRGATHSDMSEMNISGFQFTHPGRGATLSRALHPQGCPVSIHAPREGCDFGTSQHLCPNS